MKCEICGKKKNIEEHHLNPVIQNDNYTVDLCRNCHRKFHGRFKEYVGSASKQLIRSNGFYAIYVFYLVKKEFKNKKLDPEDRKDWNQIRFELKNEELIEKTPASFDQFDKIFGD